MTRRLLLLNEFGRSDLSHPNGWLTTTSNKSILMPVPIGRPSKDTQSVVDRSNSGHSEAVSESEKA